MPFPFRRILFFLLLVFCFSREGWAVADDMRADSVMERVFTYTRRNGLEATGYTSQLYVRTRLKTRRRGRWIKFVPSMFPLEKGENVYLSESHVVYRYRPPGQVDEKELAYYSTMPYLHDSSERALDRFSLSIYEPNLFSDRILSPLHERNGRFYRYKYVYSYTEAGRVLTRILIRPRFHNTQLVSGDIDVDLQTGAVRHFEFAMTYDMTSIRLVGTVGEDGLATLYPVQLDIEARLHLLGNRIEAHYRGVAGYDFRTEDRTDTLPDASSCYDQTEFYRLRTDTTHLLRSRSYFDASRPYPLSADEQAIYDRADSLAAVSHAAAREPRRRILSPLVENILLDSHKWKLGRSGRLDVPAVITPSMYQWSKSKGFYIQTSINMDWQFREKVFFQAIPRFGYNFRQRQFYWCAPLTLYLSQERNVAVRFEAGNGNHIYSADQADEIRDRLSGISHYDSLMQVFDAYDFRYYKDFYLQGDVAYEPVPGLKLSAGLRYHDRTLLGWNEVSQQSGMARTLKSLSPRLHIDWTPALYYYRDGMQKVPLYSRWPTFMLDFERGVRAGRCSGEYERWEFDAKYKYNLYALRALYFRFGFGFYTNRGEDYFVDFDYFRDNNMPAGWEDEMMGRFQLLDARWYNESKYYVRMSSVYESPMLLFSRIKYLSRIIQKERVYCNLLTVRYLLPYAEMGYGLSTHFCDVGVFVGMANHTNVSVGAKFVLRLFDGW